MKRVSTILVEEIREQFNWIDTLLEDSKDLKSIKELRELVKEVEPRTNNGRKLCDVLRQILYTLTKEEL